MRRFARLRMTERGLVNPLKDTKMCKALFLVPPFYSLSIYLKKPFPKKKSRKIGFSCTVYVNEFNTPAYESRYETFNNFDGQCTYLYFHGVFYTEFLF